jgi:hypothetical protein
MSTRISDLNCSWPDPGLLRTEEKSGEYKQLDEQRKEWSNQNARKTLKEQLEIWKLIASDKDKTKNKRFDEEIEKWISK